MAKEGKKQFSLNLFMRIVLVVLVLASIGVFASRIMRYNATRDEIREMRLLLDEYREAREELEALVGSGEEVRRLLSDYEEYQRMIQSGSDVGIALDALDEKRASIQKQINSSKNRDYIVKIAKEQLNLYYPDEEIFYNDFNH